MTAHIRPQATAPVTLEQAVTLVDEASGAGSDAIEALESAAHALQAVVARLRGAQAARAELAARVPTEMLRQVLLRRAAEQRPGEGR
jgi:hypothetical protein